MGVSRRNFVSTAASMPVPESLTVAQAAAPSGTITAVLVATALAVVLLGPSFVLLFVLDQRSMLAGEGVEDAA